MRPEVPSLRDSPLSFVAFFPGVGTPGYQLPSLRDSRTYSGQGSFARKSREKARIKTRRQPLQIIFSHSRSLA